MPRPSPFFLSLAFAGGLYAAGAGAAVPPANAPVVAATPAGAAVAGMDPLRLPETVLPGLEPLLKAALDASPRMLQGRLNMLAAEAGEQEARAALYPQVSAGAGVEGRQEVRQDLAGTKYSVKYAYGLVLSQPLWHWGALANRARLGEIQRQLAEDDLAGAQRTLVLELRAQYTGLIVRGQELRQAQEDDRRVGRKLATNEERAARGELAALDLADEKLARAQGRRQLDRLALAWDKARADFAALAGLKEFAAADLPQDIPALPDDWAARLNPDPATMIMRLYLEPVAALVRPSQEQTAAESNYEIERVRRKPVFDLVAGLRQEEVNYTVNIGSKVGVETHFIGLQVNWNIFDGGASQAAVSRARAIVRQKGLAYDEAARALQRQLTDGWKDLALEQGDLALAEEVFKSKAVRLAADRLRMDAGEIAAEDWALRLAEQEQRRIALMRQRAAQLLRVAEYALLRERGTRITAAIFFP
jgi:outer membrane protein TolC